LRRTGAKHLSLSRRLGIALAILGILQTLVPLCSLRTRSSLRIAGRLRIAFASPSSGLSSCVLPACPSPTPESSSEPGRDQEADQESNSSENLAETFTWSEAITDRRTVQGSGSALDAANGTLAPPSRSRERVRSALRRTRPLSLLAHDASTMTSRLCRFTC
jgi:hypothetical protein